MKSNGLAALRRENKRLRKCLSDVLFLCSDRAGELRSHGADGDDSPDHVFVQRLTRRVHRTVPPNRPFGLYVPDSR